MNRSPLPDAQAARPGLWDLLGYLALGTVFGVTLIKSEAVSWFRIQEMFRFQSFHMYGIILTAVASAGLGLRLVRWFGGRTREGDPICVPPKALDPGHRYWAGGIMFGVGWALVGACPGPMIALVGAGAPVFLVVILSALAGTWVYGHLRPRLPH